MKNITLILIISFLTAIHLKAAVCTSLCTGNWNDPSTWCNGQVPACGDTIVICAGHECTIISQQNYLACPNPIYIYVNGMLTFTTGNKLTLPVGSVVTVNVGGVINPGNGGGSSNLITIGTTDVWNAGSGSLPGYVVLSVAPLPIELIAFNARAKNGQVELNWETASETNNDYFTIQRTTDGIDFQSVGQEIDGAGNSTSVLSYKGTDRNPNRGSSYYRLKQTDFNGMSSYSAMVNVKIDENDFYWDLYGNLSDGSKLILVMTAGKGKECKLDIFDNRGLRVYSKIIIINFSGKHTDEHLLPFTLGAGTYVVSLSTDNDLSSRKMVVR